MAEVTSYRSIFKTTFLFGFVQVFNIIVKVGTNKAVALLLGAEGMGVIGLLNNAVAMIKTGAGLGIPQSAVRDISEAYGKDDDETFSRAICVTNRVVLLTSLLGVIVTIASASLLSRATFGGGQYTLSYVFLSVAVGFSVYSEGQLAILKGMRRLRQLAKATMIGAVAGLCSAVPLYFFFGSDGIVPSIIIVAFTALLASNYFVRKIPFKRVSLSLKALANASSSMVTMGIALMIVSFAGTLFSLAVSAYISHCGGLADVGFYQAGVTIEASYFGIVITAMSTDYYPRISAVNKNNALLQDELNKQSVTGLILVFPLAVTFIVFSSLFVRILYSSSFEPSNLYTNYALLGTIIIVVSNCMGMILLAKQAARIFLVNVLLQRTALVLVYMLFYRWWGLLGLGFSYIVTGIVHLIAMAVILRRNYSIALSCHTLRLLAIVLATAIIAIGVRTIDQLIIKYSLDALLICGSIVYSIAYMRRYLQIDIIASVKSRLHL